MLPAITFPVLKKISSVVCGLPWREDLISKEKSASCSGNNFGAIMSDGAEAKILSGNEISKSVKFCYYFYLNVKWLIPVIDSSALQPCGQMRGGEHVNIVKI